MVANLGYDYLYVDVDIEEGLELVSYGFLSSAYPYLFIAVLETETPLRKRPWDLMMCRTQTEKKKKSLVEQF